MDNKYNGIKTLQKITAQFGETAGKVDIDDPIHYGVKWTGPVIEEEKWEGTCICDDPEPENPRHGHRNSAGGYCCPHHGNSCGYHPEYS